MRVRPVSFPLRVSRLKCSPTVYEGVALPCRGVALPFRSGTRARARLTCWARLRRPLPAACNTLLAHTKPAGFAHTIVEHEVAEDGQRALLSRSDAPTRARLTIVGTTLSERAEAARLLAWYEDNYRTYLASKQRGESRGAPPGGGCEDSRGGPSLAIVFAPLGHSITRSPHAHPLSTLTAGRYLKNRWAAHPPV